MNGETTWILLVLGLILVQISVILGIFWLIRRWITAKIDNLVGSLQVFFTSPGDNQESDFAKITHLVADDFSTRLVSSLKATFMGMQSGAVRQEKALGSAVAEDMITMSNPLVGAIVQSMPAVKKLIHKNPEIAQLLPGLIEKFMGNRSAPGATEAVLPGNNGNGRVRFKF